MQDQPVVGIELEHCAGIVRFDKLYVIAPEISHVLQHAIGIRFFQRHAVEHTVVEDELAVAREIDELRRGHANHILVAAGDLIGATPLLSALFRDEPTIEALSTMGLHLSAVGNHEFDLGRDELLRRQNGGCHPVDGCQDGDDFAGANFRFLAGNVLGENDHTLFPAYKVRKRIKHRAARRAARNRRFLP